MGARQHRGRSVFGGVCIGGVGGEILSKSGQGFCLCCSIFRVSLSLTQQTIFAKVVEEECPTQMCGRIIKSFNLSMPDRTQVRG